MAGIDTNVKLLLTGEQEPGFVSDANTLLLLKMDAILAPLVVFGTTRFLLRPEGLEDGNQNFIDSGPNNLTITAFGSVDHDEANVAFNGMGIQFQGTGDYIEIVNDPGFTFPSDFAIEGYIKLNSISQDYNIYNKSQDINNRMNLIMSGTQFRYFIVVGGVVLVDETVAMPAGILPNVWFHWVFNKRRISTPSPVDRMKLFINGTEASLIEVTQFSIPNLDAPIKIGKADSLGVDFAGSMNEFRIDNSTIYAGDFTPDRIFQDSGPTGRDATIEGSGGNSPKLDRVRSAFGTHSCDFDGSDAWLQVPDDAVWQFGDFTIEFWAAFDSTLAYSVYNQFEDSDNYSLFGIDINGNATLRVRSGGVNIIENVWDLSGLGLTTFELHTYALVRNINDYDLYVDGIQVAGGFTDATAWPNIVGDVYIGKANGIAGFSDLNGMLDEYRISNNARYTGNYTPLVRFPDRSLTPKTGIVSEGQALTDFRSDRIKFNDRGITFDGSNDAVIVPDSDDFFFDGDFTIDFWFRSNSTSDRIVCGQHADASNFWSLSVGNTIRLRITSIGSLILNLGFFGGVNPVVNQLNHIAIQRAGDDYKCFVGGIQKASTIVDATAHINMPGDLRIGELLNVFTDLNGTIAEFRISKGVARYDGNFVPPSFPYSVGVESDVIVTESFGLVDEELSIIAVDATVTESLGLADPSEAPFIEASRTITELFRLQDTTNAQVSKSAQLQARILSNQRVQLVAKILTPPLGPPTNVLLANMNTGDSVLACWDDIVSPELEGVDIFLATDELGPFSIKINDKPITAGFFVMSGLAIDTYYVKLVSISVRGAAFDSVLSDVGNDAGNVKTIGDFRFTGPNGATIPAGANFVIIKDDEIIGFVSDTGGTMTPTLDITMTSIKPGAKFILVDPNEFTWTSEDTLVVLSNIGATTSGCIDNGGGPGTLITDDQESADPSDITIFTTLFEANT